MTQLRAKVVRYDLHPHPNADKLSIAIIQDTGWQCVVKKDETPGTKLGIYIPIDGEVNVSLPEFDFLAPQAKNGKFRIKTMKLRGVISQGLLLPAPAGVEFGQDLTEALGITRWEPPIPVHLGGEMVREPGSFQRYSDIENFKNYPNVFKPGDLVRVTEKIHGTNCRYGFVSPDSDGKLEFFVGSHTNAKKLDGANTYSRLARELQIAEKLQSYVENLTPKMNFIVHGEIFGGGVQDLRYGCNAHQQKFRIFDVMVDGVYQPWEVTESVAQILGVDTVPLLFRGAFDLATILSLREGRSTLAEHVREGVVVTAEPEQVHLEIGRKVLKFISDEYLLRKGATDGH